MARMAGKRAFVEQLIADGVTYIFGNPGTTEQAFMDVIQDYPELTYILCLHEGVAVSMADAYARASRRPAFVQLHIAPGLGNGVGMLYNANAGHSPLVVYVGQSATTARFQEPLLSGDLVEMGRPVAKWAYELQNAGDIPQALRRAFKVATDPPQGPVILAAPIDLLEQEVDVTIRPTSYTRSAVRPDLIAMEEAVDLLYACTNPALLIGDGVSQSRGAAEVGRLAEMLGAPIYLGYSSETNVAGDHPLLLGALLNISASGPGQTRQLLARHDLIIAVGTPLFRFIFPESKSVVPDSAKLIQIDDDNWEISKNLPGVLGIRADCRIAMAELVRALCDRPLPGAAARVTALREDARRQRSQRLAHDAIDWDRIPISVPRLMSEIAANLPSEAAIFDEAMTSSAALTRYFRPEPGRYFRARGGGIGGGLPGAIGLKLASPSLPVVGIIADGAAMFSITAIWTAAHHRVPVVWIICNNKSYRILKENVAEYRGGPTNRKMPAMDLVDPTIDFARLAEAMGVRSWRVHRPSEIGEALSAALASNAPALVDVAIESGPSLDSTGTRD